MSKRIIFILVVLLTVVTLFACENSDHRLPVKSEDEIINDLSQHHFFKNNFDGFLIDSASIKKRQIDGNNNLDRIYISLSITNPTDSKFRVEGNVNLVLEYGLYNEGWILDNCEFDVDGESTGVYFTPLTGFELTNEEIISYLDAIFVDSLSNVECYDRNTELEIGTDTYYLTAECEHKYCKDYLNITLHCNFHAEDGTWEIYHTSDIQSSIWDISGYFVFATPSKHDPDHVGIEILEKTPVEDMQLYLDFMYYGYQYRTNTWLRGLENTDNISLGSYIDDYSSPDWSRELNKGYRVECYTYSHYEYIASVNYLQKILIGKDTISVYNGCDIDDYEGIIRIELNELVRSD